MKPSPRQVQSQETASTVAPSIEAGSTAIIRQTHATLRRRVPRRAIVLVVSKGDPALVRSRRHVAWHFPRNSKGQYAGYHPGCSTSAVAHLEFLRAEGAGYLALPSTSFWWLNHYTSFRRHLETRYRRLSSDTDPCLVYSLLEAPVPGSTSAESQFHEVIVEFQRRFGREPTVLDWQSGLPLADRFPRLRVFSPPEPGHTLHYLSGTIDLVIVGHATAGRAEEARRVARCAVLQMDSPSSALKVEWQSGLKRARWPTVSLIIPCYNQSHLTEACLKTLFETLPPGLCVEVLLVDDGSTDDTRTVLRRWTRREPRLRVLRHASNHGFAAACNRGARQASGSLLVFLNNDLLFMPGWLEPLLEILCSNPRAGAVGGKLISPDGQLQEAGGVVFCDGSALNFGRGEADLERPLLNFVREVDYCSAALLATRKRVFDRLGGFDQRYRRAYYEDADYCFRLRRLGYRTVYQPASAVVHREGGTAGTDVTRGIKRYQSLNRRQFVDRWQHWLHLQPVRPMRVDDTALHALALHTPVPLASRRPVARKRALICAAFPPQPDRDSGSRRLSDLMSLLQTEGYSVTFLACHHPKDPRGLQPLQQSGIAVFIPGQPKLQALLAAGRFDLAFLTSWPVAEICLPAIRSSSPATRVVVDSVDLHFLRHARQHFSDGWDQEPPVPLDGKFAKDFTRELNAYAASDAVLAVSGREASLLLDLIPKPGLVHVWPDLEELESAPAPASTRRGVLFNGSFGHAPNLDALEFLCRGVWPRLSPGLAERHPLTIVGDPADANLRGLIGDVPHVRIVGWVPEVHPYLSRARLSVVPLRYGAGTKRKLLQSLMAGTPAVSTSVGAEGFDLRDGQHVLLADGPDSFAQAVERLLTDTRLWNRLSRRGREFAAPRHAKNSIRQRLRSILQQVGQAQPKRAPNHAPGSPPASTRLDLQQYQDLQERIRGHVTSAIPAGSRILVVSRGDDELLRLGDLKASHFPQTVGGVFAGYHPGDSEAAIAHLKALLAQGAEYLLFPQTSLWWLEFYRELHDHLRTRHRQLLNNEDCVLFRLRSAPPEGAMRRDARRPGTLPSLLPPSSTRRRPEARNPRRPLDEMPPNGIQPAQEALRSVQTVGPCETAKGPCDIVCLPIIEWGFRFQRPQQLMARFAAAGHRVFYVSQAFRSSGPPYRLTPVLPGVLEVSLRAPNLNVYRDALDDESTRMLLSSLEALRTDRSIHRAILMVQLPFWWPLARAAFSWPIVYDCMDHHAGFGTNHPRMVEAEAELLKHANLVVTSSAPLETEARRHNPNVLLVRNGCDYEHFARIRPRNRIRRPVVGYYGAIAHWFDADLVADLAERRPDWQFLLVGSTHTAALGRLVQLPNVSLPGEQPYAAIPRWLARFDVAILPFQRTPLTEATNPVKAYEILAAGKPLVSVPLPEMLGLGPIIQTASTPAQFEREIERALTRRNSPHDSERRAFARQHTWQARWEKLVRHLPIPPPIALNFGAHPPTVELPRPEPTTTNP